MMPGPKYCITTPLTVRPTLMQFIARSLLRQPISIQEERLQWGIPRGTFPTTRHADTSAQWSTEITPKHK